MNTQRIAVALPLEEDLLQPFYDWGKKFDFSHVESVHFIHVVKKNITPLEFGLVETPDEGTFHEMIPELQEFVQAEAKKILPKDFKGEVSMQLTSDFEPREEITDILKEKLSTLVVVATRGKHGIEALIHTSFTDYMIKHSPCDVFVIRPHGPDQSKSA